MPWQQPAGLAELDFGLNPSKKSGSYDADEAAPATGPLSDYSTLTGALPASDFPAPTLTKTGATARFLTTGSAFESGAILFTSAQRPNVIPYRPCTIAGVKYTATMTSYNGTLAPDPAFTLLFDTGHYAFTRQPGALTITTYKKTS